jgi:hypothetical protein
MRLEGCGGRAFMVRDALRAPHHEDRRYRHGLPHPPFVIRSSPNYGSAAFPVGSARICEPIFPRGRMDANQLKEMAERCGRLARGCNDESVASQFRTLANEYLDRARAVAPTPQAPAPAQTEDERTG